MKKEIERKIKKIMKILKKRGFFLATMESCTGGAIINAITSIPGASEITRGGIVAYSTEQKIKFGVKKKTIEKYSVYSKEVAKEMAKLAQKIFNCQIGISSTGVLSRIDPKNPEKKVGEVFLGISFLNKVFAKRIKIQVKKSREKEKEKILEIILRDLETILNGENLSNKIRR